MLRGGKERWLLLKSAVAGLGEGARPGAISEITDWLKNDPLLADYLRLHADGFDRDNMGVYWVEDILLQAGL
jgi:hypothetical protein